SAPPVPLPVSSGTAVVPLLSLAAPARAPLSASNEAPVSSADEVEEETLPEGDPPDERVVRRLWSEWTAVVEGTLADPNRTRSASEATYAEAHRALVQGCRGLARTADSTLRPMFQRLAGLVEPWLTPQTLAATDRPTLHALLVSCRQAE